MDHFRWRSTAAGALLACTLSGTVYGQASLPLIEAVRRSDVARVRTLLQGTVDVNVPQGDGTTALHWAANRDNLDIAGLLLEKGARVDAANDFGVTPLSLAAQNGSAVMVERLLKAGANPNLASSTGETPLMTAARTGSVDTVRALLARQADANAADLLLGQTPLMRAVAEGHADAANALLAVGANASAQSKSGFTPLMFAARDGDLRITRALVDAGAPINAISIAGDTALSVAVVRGQVDLAKALLDLGADPNIDKAGYTPLHWAAGKWETGMTRDYPEAQGEWALLGGLPRTRKPEMILALLSHGADVNARSRRSPPRFGIHLFVTSAVVGATPLWIAAMSADVDTVRLLVANGADPLLTTGDGTTPVMMAAGHGRAEGESWITDEESKRTVELLVSLGAGDLNAANTQGNTALHAAASQGLDETIKYLVSVGADLQRKNKNGETPLKIAEGVVLLAQLIEHPRTAEVIRSLGGTK